MRFERVGGEEAWKGKMISVELANFRFEDGQEVQREIVKHPGAVAIVAHDGESLYLVAQPREATGDPDLLELPAGKLDEEGESPLDTGKRELAEEIGKGAKNWRHLTTCYTSPGFTDEQVHVYLATDLYDEQADADENERIEVRRVPLRELDSVIEACRDAKSLIGLLWLKAYEGAAA
jgi:8-oxo-dGTP pyrophosphatase MutT (NUDIX family)